MRSAIGTIAVVGDVAIGTAAMCATWIATRYILAHAVRKSILDIPNERSLHNTPTPRGGGAAIAVVVLAFTLLLGVTGALAAPITTAVVGGGFMIATVGWLDDRHSIGAGARALVHSVAAVWTVAWIGGIPSLTWGEHAVHAGPLGSVLAVIAIVWATNFYNFMDGIDGLASAEAVAVGLAGAVLLMLAGSYGLALLLTTVAGAAAGFLAWNWTPARIFMGDVGSGFLGFLFGTLALISERAGGVPWYVWLILLLAFAGDATVTLIRRVAHGDSWHTAHRLHAYQRLVQSGLSHSQVVIRVTLLNLLLTALAIVVFVRPMLTLTALSLAVLATCAAYLAVEHRLGMWVVTRTDDGKVTSNGSGSA
ncbi:MAG TPA: glycosyltransferase family 4 protein [Gemmatimonadaceae bacterium]|nr:glycosyltransferase family 4 protein [Gemmatimonadaceae bacterium]